MTSIDVTRNTCKIPPRWGGQRAKFTAELTAQLLAAFPAVHTVRVFAEASARTNPSHGYITLAPAGRGVGWHCWMAVEDDPRPNKGIADRLTGVMEVAFPLPRVIEQA